MCPFHLVSLGFDPVPFGFTRGATCPFHLVSLGGAMCPFHLVPFPSHP